MATEGPLTAAQIYEQITGGEGTGSLADAQDSARNLTTRMIERAQRISALRAKTMSGWQGGAGDSASDATLPLVKAAADDAVHLQNAQTAVGDQMDAFGTAKNSVKPVAPQPPELTNDDIINALNGDHFRSYNTKVTNWQADSQANIDAFRAYHSASSTNGGQMPAQYAQLADSGAPITMNTPGNGTHTQPTDTGEWARKPRQPQVPAQQNRQTTQTQQPNQTQTQTQNQFQNQNQNQVQNPNQYQNQFQNQVNRPVNQDGTHADSYVPRPVLPPAAQNGYEFGPTGQPVSNLGGSTSYSPYPGFGPGTGGYAPGSTGTGTGAGTGPGYRPGTGTGTGTGTTPGQPGMRNPGPGSGSRLPEERFPGGATRAGAAGPRGANGMPMGGPMAGRGGKEEDREKKTASYLQNPDPDETFGGLIEKPMPPVIGENRAKP
ncbi:PPE domain-containing protein [Amycolatopsis australiensis]|uniref:PPE family protein n=1 Tax=Amycolatopsis australiensis TaxID=546364 RepID=A0A1K1PIM5_9PSEU|nr:PPE domain-containing protein [Amycolatopsis australiensis]SFW47650.1 PPE family protein [Amycolatopsis australiensis]